jgi:hypothetical protein
MRNKIRLTGLHWIVFGGIFIKGDDCTYTIISRNRFLKIQAGQYIKKCYFWATQGMRSIFLAIFLLFFLLPSCSPKSGSTAKVVKPKYHHRWYDRKKDRHKSRTKQIKVAS